MNNTKKTNKIKVDSRVVKANLQSNHNENNSTKIAKTQIHNKNSKKTKHRKFEFINKYSAIVDKFPYWDKWWLMLPFVALFIYLFFISAWVSDDAYITFRTIDNFINGYGLTWNTVERVQSYTHPLWMFLLSAFYYFTREIFITNILVSFILCMITIYILSYKLSSNMLKSIIGLTILCFSKPFIDYTSSGLENSLSYLLIAIFIWILYKCTENKMYIFWLSLIASLATLNRMDTFLMYMPVLLLIFLKNRSYKSLLYIILGFLPFVFWEIFSLLYYGFPFPNTAYSKLQTGIPGNEIFSQGINYFIDCFENSPITILTICIGIIIFAIQSIRKKIFSNELLIGIGVLFYVFYCIKIGGDFMSGRFYSAPLIMIVCTLMAVKYEIKKIYNIIIFVFVAIISIMGKIPVTTGINFGSNRAIDESQKMTNPWYLLPFVGKSGICDERQFYFPYSGFLPVITKGKKDPQFIWAWQGDGTRHGTIKTVNRGAIGYFGYYCGQNIYVIDFHGLSDAFLARLPAKKKQFPTWRIGHFERVLPKGYYETIDKNKNIIEDKDLARFYDKINIVIRGNIFDSKRLAEIWNFNTGKYNYSEKTHYSIDDNDFLPFAGDSLSLSEFYNNIAIKYKDQNNKAMALKYYKLGFGYDKYNMAVAGNFINHLIQDNDVDQCLEIIKQLPKDKQAQYEGWLWNSIGLKAYHEGNIDKGIELSEKSVSIYPEWAPSHNNLGAFYIIKKNFEKAEYHLKKAIELDNKMMDAYLNLYKIYVFQNRMKEASQYAEKAEKLGANIDPKQLEYLRHYK